MREAYEKEMERHGLGDAPPAQSVVPEGLEEGDSDE